MFSFPQVRKEIETVLNVRSPILTSLQDIEDEEETETAIEVLKEVLNKVLDDLNTYTTPFEELPDGSRHLQTVTLDGGHRGRWGLRDV